MRKRLLRIGVGLLFLAVIAGITATVTLTPSVSAQRPHVVEHRPEQKPVSLAAPGRTEGASETIAVGAATDGVIQDIYVKEGQTVEKSTLLAEMSCEDLESGLEVALAEAEAVRQSRVRLMNGSRPEERQAAAQRTAQLQAVESDAARALYRAQKLSEANAISQAASDQAKRDYEVGEAELKQALRNEELVNAGPTKEDLARATANVKASENRVKLAKDKLDKCAVRAPISGTILRVSLRPGESFSTIAPHPIFTIADLSGRRVRAEVDERDVGRVYVGQKAVVYADAYSGLNIKGTVTELATVMGRKSVETGNPADKNDRDVLEAIVRLQDPEAAKLPIGLRVTVRFQR